MSKQKKYIDPRSQILSQYWIRGQQRRNIDRDKVFERIAQRISDSEQTSDNQRKLPVAPGGHAHRARPSSILKYAAVILVIVTSSFYLFKGLRSDILEWERNQTSDELVLKSNPRGRMTTHILSDGTTVKLNAESKLEYPKFFSGNTREVSLVGEAWFEVAEDPAHPFIISSGNIKTRVLGTDFNIKAYPDDDNIEVALLDGRVEVEVPGGQHALKVQLEPKEMLIFNRMEQQWHSTTFDPAFELAWKDGTIVFRNADIEEVVKQLERWYGVKIFVKNRGDLQTNINVTYTNDPLDLVLEGLSFQENFKWHFADKEHKVIIIDFLT